MLPKIPKAFLQASATISEKKTKLEAATVQTASPQQSKTQVKARINMSAEVAGRGLCPECQKPMTRTTTNGVPVLSCDEHRIAVPLPDEPLAETEAPAV